jgi:hypothetical protein
MTIEKLKTSNLHQSDPVKCGFCESGFSNEEILLRITDASGNVSVIHNGRCSLRFATRILNEFEKL